LAAARLVNEVHDSLAEARIARHERRIEVCAADHAVLEPAFFLQALQSGSDARSGNRTPLAENLADLENRDLTLIPDDFHDFALAFRQRR